MSDLTSKTFGVDDNKIIIISSRVKKTVVNLSKNNKFGNLTHMPNIGATKKSLFLIPDAKKAFNHLK